MKFLQRLGKSLMLPVSVLPICGILMGIGYMLCPASMQGSEVVGVVPTIGYFLVKAGGAIIDNMSWLFVIGVSVGMSDDNHGASCLAGIVSYLMVTTLLSVSVISVIIPWGETNALLNAAFSKIQNPFIAIVTGILGAFCYNKYKNTSLPQYFSFFSGRRFVIIITAVFSLLATLILAVVWPLAFWAFTKLGNGILSLGGVGVGIYAFLNRLLIPFGLHHALNNVFWFDTIGIGDLASFWAGKTSEQVGWSLGMYMSGFFPCIMFGIPGAALAMIKRAKNRAKTASILISTAVCAFVCGVTEPFEFAFMFVAFPLYVVYCVLYGIFAAITYYSGFRAGFSFSAGATDLLFSSSLPAASKTWMIIPLGALAFGTFYLVFSLILKRKKYPIPGSEDTEEVPAEESFEKSEKGLTKNSDSGMAYKLLEALGGSGNLISIDSCATRLRLEVKNVELIDHEKIKKAGAIASRVIGKNACQIIIGTSVWKVCEELKEAAKTKESVSVAPEDTEAEVNHISIDLKNRVRLTRGEKLHFSLATSFDMIINAPNGIHARPAALIANTAKRFEADSTLMYEGKTASLKSSTQIMALGVSDGAKVSVTVKGPDEEKAVTAIKGILEGM